MVKARAPFDGARVALLAVVVPAYFFGSYTS